MKDAFGKKLAIGSKVLYSIRTSGPNGTIYLIGEVSKLYPLKEDLSKSYTPPDRVAIKVSKSTNEDYINLFTKDPIIYAANVVLLPLEE